MRNPFELISTLFFHYRVLGVGGILLLFKRVLYKKKTIRVKIKDYKNWIYLRNNTSDVTVFYQVFLEKSYAHNYQTDARAILDCGANIGLSSVFYANKFPNAKILAIEPQKLNYDILLKNTSGYNNIQGIYGGIWNKKTNLIIKNNMSASWEFEVIEANYSSVESIPAYSLPDLMIEHNFKKIDILKIDIEGSEKELFQSNYKSWLSNTKILLIELHDGLRKGSSKSVFKAIVDYEFSMIKKNENLIFTFHKNGE
tara:strand:+ start:3646 stop:4410 length:765 start_codon:yes stop_codon:yes gene_type:complete